MYSNILYIIAISLWTLEESLGRIVHPYHKPVNGVPIYFLAFGIAFFTAYNFTLINVGFVL